MDNQIPLWVPKISEITKVVVESLNVSIDIMDVRNFRRENPPTIHQIPVDMRKGNESAYTPTQFPIGPYHRHEDKLLFFNGETDGIKILYLNHLLTRNPNTTLEDYVSAIESREDEARDCYHDRCKGVESKDFVEMMVLDGCFIVELFLKCCEGKINNESWILRGGNIRDLVHDLMLMENQIPFFILKLIHDHSQYQVEGVGGILDLSLHCLYFLGCSAGKNITKDMLKEDQKEGEYQREEEDGKNIHHLLHLNYLCHMVKINPEKEHFSYRVNMLEKLNWVLYWAFLLPIKYFLVLFFNVLIYFLKFIKLATKIIRQKRYFGYRRKVRAEREPKPSMLPTATELNEYGVIFKRKKNAKNYMDVSFKNGIMEIPVLKIDDSTNSAFRNFLALEYFCPNLGNKFTTYVIFLDYLIDTTGDVSFLKNRKIVINLLGRDEDVAKLFSAMTDGLICNNKKHYLFELFKDVGVYWETDADMWRAKMMRNYFISPLSTVSFLGALILLAFTATQVYYTIKKGRSP